MRRSAWMLLGVGGAALCAALLAATDLPPAVVVFTGIVLAGLLVASRTDTDRLLWLATCLFVLTVTWNGLRVAGGAVGNFPLGLMTLAAIAHVIITRKSPPIPPWLAISALLMFAAWLFTALVPPEPSLLNIGTLQVLTRVVVVQGYLDHRPDLPVFLEFEVALLLIPLVLVTAARTRARVTRLLDIFVVSAGLNAFVGIADFAGLGIGPYPLDGTRAAGLTLHPNYLGLTCLIALPLAMRWLVRSDPRWRLTGAGAVLLILGGILASGSRAGFAASAVAILATTMVLPGLRRAVPLVVPVAGMLLVAVLTWTHAGQDLLHQVRLHDASTSGSNFQRKQAADVGWTQIRARPFSGVGMQVIADAHSIYLELLAAGGVVLLASFLVFVSGIFSMARRALRNGDHTDGAAAAVAVASWLLNGVVDNQLADKYLFVVPGLLLALGLLAPQAAEQDQPVAATARPTPRHHPGLVPA